MAAKTKAMATGSMPWLDQENQQFAQFTAQEADDFAFSVRNELDFLNEHMAEIFSKNQINMTEVFKTPGKLRGKTPRTARKRNPLEVREPLNDIFAPNAKITASPKNGPNFPKDQRHFQVARDAAIPKVEKKMKINNDSGYHGMTEDEMELDEQGPVMVPIHPEGQETAGLLHLEAPKPRQSRERTALDSSFHSTKEDLTRETSNEASNPLVSEPASPRPQASNTDEPATHASSPQPKQPKSTGGQTLDLGSVHKASPMDVDIGNDSLHSPSEGPSPAAKGLIRKSSLNFAALPAREPLTTKMSIGARLSRASHVDVSKGIVSRGSFLGRITGGKSLGGSRQPETAAEIDDHDQMDVDDSERPGIGQEESDNEEKETKLHNMSSTQRLHERINLLGKSQPARPTKSIPAATVLSQAVYPELHLGPAARDAAPRSSREDEEDDDWIQPPASEAEKSPRPQLSKSISADVMENLRGKTNISDEEFGREQQHSPRRHSLKSEHASPNVAPSVQAPVGIIASPSKTTKTEQTFPSTTSIGTPVLTRHVDGPISASKSKLQSIMKTARGLFTSSAGASAQAKMELRNQAKIGSPDTTSPSKATANGEDIDLYPKLQADQANLALPAARPENSAKPAEGRRTRGSIEKEKKEKERRQVDMESEKPKSDEEIQQTTTSKHEQGQDDSTDIDRHGEAPGTGLTQPPKLRQQPTRKLPDVQHPHSTAEAACDNEQDNVIAKVSQPQSQQSQLQRPREVKRPVKPAKEAAPKPEPQRVAIRVGTLSQRIPLSNAALSSGLQDSLPPPPNKQPGLSKKTSTASMQTSASNTSLRSATASKPKALIAAEKKKEQDEREAQRKLEQKREIERKRATQQEESRRQEQLQRREAERQREQDRAAIAEDPKKAAQRQAIEKRRQELAKKDQQRTAPAPQQIPPNSRPELGGAKPSKIHATQDFGRSLVNHHPAANSAKAPIKRGFEHEADEPVRQSRLPGGQPYQGNDAKRRRTDDKTPEEPNVRPTMVPPKRQSNLLKDAQRPYGPSLMGPPSSIGNGYPHSKAPATNHSHPSQYQHQAQASRPGQAPQDMAKYANGRIVFAENTNSAYASHKTPNHARLTNPPFAKSSPQYVNGENIQLEDIPTDSDEDDSEDEGDKKAKGAMLPSWVQSPALNELLREQERSKDPDSIFGPSAAVNMEEMFKERHHRFRSRTSSANWAGNDRLTEEEIRSDNAAREKMRREGGWTFGL
ncbi:MAG: hypothetical protein Q9211_001239 [Gyalolechia sp. 1 TL-2023]